MEGKIEFYDKEEIEDQKYARKVFKRILGVVLVFIGLIIGFKIAIFFLPFVIAFIINRITRPFVKFLDDKCKFNHKASVIISVVLVVAILGSLIFFVSTKVVDEVYTLATSIPKYTVQLQEGFNWITTQASDIINQLPNALSGQIYSAFNSLLDTLVSKGAQVATTLVNGVMSLPTFLIYTIITILATIFIGFDKIYILESFEQQLPEKWMDKIVNVARDAFGGIAAYVKSQATIIIMTFVELLIGFNILDLAGFNIEYKFALAVLIAIIDAFPILGCGTVLIPWAVFNAFTGNISMAIGIFILYLIITIVRQLLEPKIISKNIGVHPIFTLIAMYTGFKLFGFLGFIFGPIIMFMLKNIFAKQLERGFFRDIFKK